MKEEEFKKLENTLFKNSNKLVQEAKDVYERMLKNHTFHEDNQEIFESNDRLYNIYYFLGTQGLVCILNRGKKSEHVALKFMFQSFDGMVIATSYEHAIGLSYVENILMSEARCYIDVAESMRKDGGVHLDLKKYPKEKK